MYYDVLQYMTLCFNLKHFALHFSSTWLCAFISTCLCTTYLSMNVCNNCNIIFYSLHVITQASILPGPVLVH